MHILHGVYIITCIYICQVEKNVAIYLQAFIVVRSLPINSLTSCFHWVGDNAMHFCTHQETGYSFSQYQSPAFSQYPHPHHHHHTTITTQPLLPYLKCTWWRHDKNTLSVSLAMCEGNCLIIKCQWCEEMLSCCYAEQKAEQAIELLPPIQDNITLMPRQYNSVYLQRYKINHYSNCVTLREYWDKQRKPSFHDLALNNG